eukprot:TRINITY_DN484_c0_g1_i1.p1 TRINITY_DN484_c0_g1~~TRINITY_DN484_c0_g1_i1.p1  ORF type:complete len:254 (+),score=76.68 TRINITY_DN484_c0_g1_i1:153-914(+)
METLITLKAKYVTIAAVALSLLTIFGCYILAVLLGHVDPWIPMISDCGVYPPETYFFRMGLVVSAMLLELNSVAMLAFLHSLKVHGLQCCDKFGFFVASLACFGLATVAVVNEKENGTVHGTAAVIFFLGYLIYMMLTTLRFMPLLKTSDIIDPVSVRLKSILTLLSIIFLTSFVLFSMDYGRFHNAIAFCEWSGTVCIILYNFSFIYEYKENTLLQIVYVDNNSRIPTKNPVPFVVMTDGVVYHQIPQVTVI